MYLVQTVQTSWRPQLPLPKEVNVSSDDNANDLNKSSNSHNDMERHLHHKKDKDNSINGSQISSNMSGSQHGGGNSGKKWSFGRLFRSKKKEVESASSSEEDRKAGFSPAHKFPRNSGSKTKAKGKSNRNSKLIGAGFDHVVVNPQQDTPPPVKRPPPPQNMGNEFFLPFETTTTAMVTQEPFYHNQQQQQQQQTNNYPQQYLLHPQQMPLSRSSNSLDRRAMNAVSLSPKIKSHSAQRLAVAPGTQMPVRSSSEEELISLNSSTFSKYRSDESIHSGGQGQNGQSRRSRAARNERYYKRLSRDGEVSHGQVPVMYAPQPAQRWKTQPVPLSVYNAQPVPQPPQQPVQQPTNQPTTSQRLRNAGSLQHVTPYVQWGQVQKQPKNLQNSVNDSKRSISYDSQIHLQNVNGRLQTKPLPPPPPPRDPTRRLNVVGQVTRDNSSSELRPLSYAFDVNGLPTLPATNLNGRCVSDDKIWASQAPLYQSAHSLNVTPSTNTIGRQQPTHRRFITRAERDAQPGKKSLPNGLDMHYIADATPRSRKPIHLFEQADNLLDDLPPPSSGIVRTTKSGLPSSPPKAVASNFWKRLEESAQVHTPPANATTLKSADTRHNPSPMYSEVYKPNRKPLQQTKSLPEPKHMHGGVDEVDHVVCGSLQIKPSPDGATKSYVEIRNKDAQKSHSMPNHYHRRSGSDMQTTPNKYEEYVAEKRELHHNLADYPPTPPQRKLSTPLVVSTPKAASQPAPPVYIPHKKPANLEEAISELEAIYKSLRIGNEPPVERKERVPTPSDFEKFALARADSYDDDESPTGEPDPINDDVAYRNIKLANLQHKTNEKQPPFGIPIGPIVPSPHNDYLHVTPDKNKKTIVVQKRVPDIIKDDLAVRALRKDAPGPKPHFVYPSGSLQKKNRATRTQSANIYSLIQRDAAKPSGGDYFSFMELTKNIDRSGSMSDLHHGEGPADIPATLQLLLNLKEQDLELSAPKKSPSIPFRHPSQGGAICQLPEKLTSTQAGNDEGYKPVPMPRTILTPEPSSTAAGHHMDDALNKIAKDAQESSAKLTKELRELRKEALITASRPKAVSLSGEAQIEQDLQEIEAVSEAAKRCGKMLLENFPDSNENLVESSGNINKPRKLHKEGKLIKAIDQVSVAANAVCEKILKDIVTTEPPVVVQDAVKVQNARKEENLVMPNLIKKLDPVKSDEIEAIARRCMRQISQLSESTDYDNLGLEEADTQPACNDLSAQAGDVNQMKVEENLPSSIVSEKRKRTQASREMDEIDRIMKECEAQVQSEGGGHSSGTATATLGSHQQLIEDKTTASSLTTSGSSSNNSAPGKCTSSTNASSFSSSSDCLAKSSSPSAGRRFSSSITSFNPYSSSDYIKSPSSDFHAPSTDPIKTFSTTSYDVASTSETPNITTNSTFSYSPSPPLNLTPVSERAVGNIGSIDIAMAKRERSSSPSAYNSSEELAMIFGIEENSKQQQQRRLKVQQQHQTHPGKVGPYASMSSTSSSNHASSLACNSPAACCVDKVVDCLNVVNVSTTTATATATTTNSTISPYTNSNNITSCSSKLDTIPEIVFESEETEQGSLAEDVAEAEDVLRYSHNFNKIYASKISIIVDEVKEDKNLELLTPLTTTLSPQNLDLTQFDSLSSLEETSSNPDSGNVSLADFPLFVGGTTTNASLQLQTVYNSRFEVRNNFVSEVCIGSSSSSTELEELNESIEDEFPRLPTEEELIESLKEDSSSSYMELDDDLKLDETMAKMVESVLVSAAKVEDINEESKKVASSDLIGLESNSINENCSYDLDCMRDLREPEEKEETIEASSSVTPPPQRKRSIVYETPQLNMIISEVRHNYEPSEVESTASVEEEKPAVEALEQITNCIKTVEELNKTLSEMPRRRRNSTKHNKDDSKPSTELSLLPWQPNTSPRTINPSSEDHHGDDEKPTTSARALTVLGEAPRANSLTVLENILVACSLGLLTSNDIFTLLLIIVGVITIFAIVLYN